MTKQETLIEMLKQYREAECTLLHTGDGSGGHTPQMSVAWNSSFRELERCLHVLTGERPKQTRMLLARYVDSTPTRRRLTGRRDSKGTIRFPNAGTHLEVRTYVQLADSDRRANEWDCVVIQWPKWVKQQQVNEALTRLEQLYRGEPYLLPDMVTLDKAEDVRHHRVKAAA